MARAGNSGRAVERNQQLLGAGQFSVVLGAGQFSGLLLCVTMAVKAARWNVWRKVMVG